MTKRQSEAIFKHMQNLARIFPRLAAFIENDKQNTIDAYATLRDLERRASKLAEDQCNRPLSEGYVERTEASILGMLDNLIGWKDARVPVFCNGDPRGYGLKIHAADADSVDPERHLHRDWGGYGIIAPNFEEDGS